MVTNFIATFNESATLFTEVYPWPGIEASEAFPHFSKCTKSASFQANPYLFSFFFFFIAMCWLWCIVESSAYKFNGKTNVQFIRSPFYYARKLPSRKWDTKWKEKEKQMAINTSIQFVFLEMLLLATLNANMFYLYFFGFYFRWSRREQRIEMCIFKKKKLKINEDVFAGRGQTPKSLRTNQMISHSLNLALNMNAFDPIYKNSIACVSNQLLVSNPFFAFYIICVRVTFTTSFLFSRLSWLILTTNHLFL